MSESWRRRCAILKAMMRKGGTITTREAVRVAGARDKETAIKDLKALVDCAGVKRVGEGRDAHWALPRTDVVLGMDVSLQDRLALRVGRDFVGGMLRDTDFSESLQNFDEQVARLDPEEDATKDALDRRFYFIHEPEKDYSPHRATLALVAEALLGSYFIAFEYGDRRHTSVRPYTLVAYKRGLYLLAMTGKRDPTTFAVERMRAVEVSEERFDYPYASAWDPRRHLARCFGIFPDPEHPPQRVRLRFEPAAVRYVENRRWMPTQRIVPGPGGTLELEFEATGRELVGLVLQFGELVEVIEPSWLREQVADRLRRAAARYG